MIGEGQCTTKLPSPTVPTLPPLTLTSPTLPLTLPGQTSHICIVCWMIGWLDVPAACSHPNVPSAAHHIRTCCQHMCHSQAERVTCHVSRVTCHVSPDTQHTCDTLSRHSFCVCSAVSPLSVTLTRHPQTSSEPTSSCYNSADSYSSQTMNNHQQVLIRLCELAQRAQRKFCMHTHWLITDCCLLLMFILSHSRWTSSARCPPCSPRARGGWASAAPTAAPRRPRSGAATTTENR